jgi:hypothetical protein
VRHASREFNRACEKGGLEFDSVDFRTRDAFFAFLAKASRLGRSTIGWSAGARWSKIVGRGITKDTGKAVQWSGRSSEKRSTPPAQTNLVTS